MKSFKIKDKSFDLSLNIGVAKKIKSRLDVDILTLDETTLERLSEDDLLLLDILEILLEGQDVNFDDWEGQDVLEATKTLFKELCFFLTVRGRPEKAEILKAWIKLIEKARQELAEKITGI